MNVGSLSRKTNDYTINIGVDAQPLFSPKEILIEKIERIFEQIKTQQLLENNKQRTGKIYRRVELGAYVLGIISACFILLTGALSLACFITIQAHEKICDFDLKAYNFTALNHSSPFSLPGHHPYPHCVYEISDKYAHICVPLVFGGMVGSCIVAVGLLSCGSFMKGHRKAGEINRDKRREAIFRVINTIKYPFIDYIKLFSITASNHPFSSQAELADFQIKDLNNYRGKCLKELIEEMISNFSEGEAVDQLIKKYELKLKNLLSWNFSYLQPQKKFSDITIIC